jgi:hypothetical protein
MGDQQIRNIILKHAYNKAKESGSIEGGTFNVYKINELEGIDKNIIDFNADYLDQKNIVKYATMGGNMRITVTGVDNYEDILHK